MSLPSLNDKNLYEISIGSVKQKKYPGLQPRRVGLMSSLATLSESKRPGEYYIQKLSQSSAHLPKHARRPPSGISVSGSDTSKDSDDALLVGLSQFDPVDSRLSSMTTNLLYLARPVESAAVKKARESAEDVDQMSLSISTITLENDPSASDLTDSVPRIKPKLRSLSTSNMLEHKQMSPSLTRTRTASSSFLLTRSKTKYYNPKEKKERQQLRKKLYDDNDDDDEILTNDLDLVFNVPMIKNYGEIYRYRKNSSSTVLSRNDLSMDDDSKYYSYNSTVSMKPCPLPGKLTLSNVSVDTTLALMPEDEALELEESAVDDSTHFSFSNDNDGEISQNISEFYGQRSVSYSMLVKQSREQHMIYKLPNYIRSQTSIEDISLISPEKLEMVDQSRPINLPPKCSSDKAKHSKEFHRALSGYELTTKNQSGARKKLGELFIINQQAWFKLMITVNDDKEFRNKLAHDKEKIRKLSWESLISEKFRFDYYMKVLTLNSPKGHLDQIKSNLDKLEAKYNNLPDKMKAAKDAEFDNVVNQVLLRPMFLNFVQGVAAKEDSEFDLTEFRSNFKHLLYLKSLSDDGLKKHHEIFVIPMFLIYFQTQQSFENIWSIIELFDNNVFTTEILGELNKKLATWKDLTCMSSSSMPYKILSKFESLKEFEYLSSVSFFELLIQLNDRLPLSLSAPSTPIVAQGAFTPLTSAKQSGEFGAGTPAGLATSSLENFAELSMSTTYHQSSSLSLIGVLLQLLVTYSNSPKSKKQNFLRLIQGFLLTIFKFYHINWNSTAELVKINKSIKLNNSSDEMTNLDSFLDKWREIFKKM